MNEKIYEITERIANLNIGEKAKTIIQDMLVEVGDLIEEKETETRCYKKTADALQNERDKFQYEANGLREENKVLKNENGELGEKLENAKKSIDESKRIMLDQQTRIGKLQALVTDVVNKI